MKQVLSQQGFTLVKHANMKQSSGGKIKELTVKSISECLQHCLSDCRCSAFDIREDDMMCYLKPYRDEMLEPEDGYSHFVIKQVTSCLSQEPGSAGDLRPCMKYFFSRGKKK